MSCQRALGCLLLVLVVAPCVRAEALPEVTVADAAALRQAMAEVGPGDRRVIRLNGGHYSITTPESSAPDGDRCADASLPVVRGGITIAGEGGIIAGSEGAFLPFCVVEGGELVLHRLTLEDFGGPVRHEEAVVVAYNSAGGVLRLQDVVIRNTGSPDRIGGRSAYSTTLLNAGRLELDNVVTSNNDVVDAQERFPRGGILDNRGELVARNSVFSNNVVSDHEHPSGVILLRGPSKLVNVTVSGNSHGIYVHDENVLIDHATVFGNGYGILNFWGAIIRNSVLASNHGGDCIFTGPTEPATLFQGVNLDSDNSCGLDPPANLAGVSPRLGPLRRLEGDLPGHEPEPGSPVLDRADPRFCPFRDAVGRVRNTATDSDARCALGAIEPPNRPPHFEIDARLTGTWFDPDHDGHYLSVQVLPGGRLSALWWTYDRLGNPFWLVAAGDVSGGEAQLTAWESEGMRLPGLDDAEREVREWGTLELDFRGCRALELRWRTDRPGFGDGRAELQRLTINTGLEC